MVRTQILTVALLVCAFPCLADEVHPGYEWQEVDDGIYLHSAANPLAGPVDGNSVVIVTDKEIFVVDTHINPAAARAMIDKICAVAGRPVTHIINTHWHDDHTNGNHAFREAYPEAKIFSHTATLAALRKEWAPMEEQRKAAYADVTPQQILKAAMALENPDKAIGYHVYAGYVDALKPELETMQLVYPDTVFDDKLVFSSGGRRIVVQWLGRGNTDGDVVVWLPDDALLITGDLLVAPIPFAFDSPMVDWISTLERLGSLGARTIIPGHGAVQRDTVYLDRVLALLRATVGKVRAAKEHGTPIGELAHVVDLSELEQLFTGGDADKTFAWQSYFVSPGLKSAWLSLGYPLPDE